MKPSRERHQQSTARHGTHRDRRLQKLYERQYHNLRRYLQKLVGSGPPDPDDVAQTAFARLSARENLDDIDHLPAFLWRTAQNIVSSERRAAAIRKANAPTLEALFVEDVTDASDPQRVLLARSELETVTAALHAMQPKRRDILLMSRIDGYSNAEIARRLGLARSTVSEHLSNALLDLEHALHPDEEPDWL